MENKAKHETPVNVETMSEEEVQGYLEKVDREAATRSFGGIMKHFFFWSCIAVTLYHLYVSLFGTPPVHMHRSLHVGLMLALAFFLYPLGKKTIRKKMAFYDWIFCVLALSSGSYLA